MKHILHIVLVLILSIGCFQGFAQTPSDTVFVGKNVRIQTYQGHDIRGVITAENEVHLHIKLDNNTVVTVAKINVRRIDFLGEQPLKSYPDSLFQGNHNMYFLNYTALPFEANSGQFDVSSFGATCMSMNLSKRFSVGARYLFFNAFDFSGMFNLKLKEHFYAGIHFGWLARFTSFSQSNFDKDDWGFNINLKFTVGTSQKNFTVGIGGFSSLLFSESSKVMTLSGMYPIDQRILLVCDGSYMVDKKTGGFGLGIRLLGKTNWSIDLGMGQTLFPEDKKKYIPDFKIISFEKFIGDLGFPFIGFHKKF